jgi:hypothetical protein
LPLKTGRTDFLLSGFHASLAEGQYADQYQLAKQPSQPAAIAADFSLSYAAWPFRETLPTAKFGTKVTILEKTVAGATTGKVKVTTRAGTLTHQRDVLGKRPIQN